MRDLGLSFFMTLTILSAAGCGSDVAEEASSGSSSHASSGVGGQGGAGGQAGTGGQGGTGEDPALPPSPKRIPISVGGTHVCAMNDAGQVRCWGDNGANQLGQGPNKEDIGDDETPASTDYVDIGGKVVQISAGSLHSCALLDSGNVRCWGSGASGQLGYGAKSFGNDIPAVAGDVDVGGKVVQVAAGGNHTCALLASGNVRCWGLGEHGSLGYGNKNNIGDKVTPASAGNVDVGGKVVQISACNMETCALLASGNVRCWGRNDYGELGYGNTNTIGDDETPASAGDIALGGKAVQISVGYYYACALLESGNVRCWGVGDDGRLGYGNTNVIGDDETPASAGDVDIGGKAIQIDAGGHHTCALLDSGKLHCWGEGLEGAVGYGNKDTIGDDETPASAGDVDVGGEVTAVSADSSNTCAVLATGAFRCWGAGFRGLNGHGNKTTLGDDETPASAGDVPVF